MSNQYISTTNRREAASTQIPTAILFFLKNKRRTLASSASPSEDRFQLQLNKHLHCTGPTVRVYGPEVGEGGPEEVELEREPIDDEGETIWFVENRVALLCSGTER